MENNSTTAGGELYRRFTDSSRGVTIATINLDASIQCRASIDMEVVNDYSERMRAGDTFPPVEVYGNQSRCWIGDGWHRVLAAKQIDQYQISAHLRRGGRAAALKHALGANLVHGHRRSNADKRRAVEIALREFATLSNVAIAKMCAVDDKTVAVHRPDTSGTSEPETRTGEDGKQYPARRKSRVPPSDPEGADTHEPDPKPDYTGHLTARQTPSAPSNGMQFARIAIMKLEEIRDNDTERQQAFTYVKKWLIEQEAPERAS